MILEDRYREFLKNTGKENSYNLAYAWIGRQEEAEFMAPKTRSDNAKIFAKF